MKYFFLQLEGHTLKFDKDYLRKEFDRQHSHPKIFQEFLIDSVVH